MTTVYWSLCEVTKDRRFTDLTQPPATKTAHKIDPAAKTATALSGTVEWTKLPGLTGRYIITVSDADDGLDVMFSVVPHVDDQADYKDVALLHERALSYQVTNVDTVVDAILVDTDTTIPALIAAVAADVWAYATRELTMTASAAAAAVAGTGVTTVEPTTTRQTIRRELARALGIEFFREYPEGYVTATGGTTITIDSDELTQEDDWWRGCTIYFIDGDEAGNERVVTEFADLNNRCTWRSALSTGPAVGDKFELYDHWTATLIHDALNRAIEEGKQWFPNIERASFIMTDDKYVYSLLAYAPKSVAQVWVRVSSDTILTTISSKVDADNVILSATIPSTLKVGDYISIYSGDGASVDQWSAITAINYTTNQVTVSAWDDDSIVVAGDKVRVWSSVTNVIEVPLSYIRFDQDEYPNTMFIERNYDAYLGFPIYMKYVKEPAALTSESSTTTLPIGYLIPKTLAFLSSTAMMNTDFEYSRWSTVKQLYEEEALRYRLDFVKRAPAVTQWLSSPTAPRLSTNSDPMNWLE